MRKQGENLRGSEIAQLSFSEYLFLAGFLLLAGQIAFDQSVVGGVRRESLVVKVDRPRAESFDRLGQ